MAKKAPTFDSILSDVRKGQFAPVYFLFGEEPFLTEELEREIVSYALQAHERDFNFDLVYGAETDARNVIGLCSGYPVMAQRRVVVVRDFDKLEENREFQSYLQQPNPSCVALLTCFGKPNLSKHPYRALRQHAVSVEATSLRDREMPGWIERRLKQSGYSIEPQALQMLVDFLGTDLRGADKELQKLQTFLGDRTSITADDVVLASGQTRDISVFELQRAVGEGRYNDAVRTGERLLQQASNVAGESLIIISILTSFFLKLWKLTPLAAQRLPEPAIAGQLGVRPFFVKEYQNALRRYGPDGVERALAAVLAADFAIKGGAAHDPRTTLVMLLRRIMQPV
jgi:DNA polymerase III subunit delta